MSDVHVAVDLSVEGQYRGPILAYTRIQLTALAPLRRSRAYRISTNLHTTAVAVIRFQRRGNSLEVLSVLNVGHLSLVGPEGSDGDSWDTDKERDLPPQVGSLCTCSQYRFPFF